MNGEFEIEFIKQAAEGPNFTNIRTQKFFAELCKIYSFIVPKFIPRETWNQKKKSQKILEKNEKNQTLFLPEDLHLWEMMDVIRNIDHGIFAGDPDKKEERVNQLQELGDTFKKVGLYFLEYQNILEDKEEQKIANKIAHDFYQYGLPFQGKERGNDQIHKQKKLSQEDKIEVDKWLLGQPHYEKRIAKLDKNLSEEQREDARKELLQIFFKALTREGFKADGKKPWETKVGPMYLFQERVREKIITAIQCPKREMIASIFESGVENLIEELVDSNGENLYDTLHINELKQELEKVKETGTTAEIAAKEMEIAKKIQKAVLDKGEACGMVFIYKLHQRLKNIREESLKIENTQATTLDKKAALGSMGMTFSLSLNILMKTLEDANRNFPKKKLLTNKPSQENYLYNFSEMVNTQFMTPIGLSVIGAKLLDKVGIKYLHADIPRHSATVLITSDGKVYWQDFTIRCMGKDDPHSKNYTEIVPEMIDTQMPIKECVKDASASGKSIIFPRWNPYADNHPLRVKFFESTGLQFHILFDIAVSLHESGHKVEDAIKIFQELERTHPNDSRFYNKFGNALRDSGKIEEAIKAYKQAIHRDEEYALPYVGLGNALRDFGEIEKAIEAYKQAIHHDEEYAPPYERLGNALRDFGEIEKAIEAYQKFLELCNDRFAWKKPRVVKQINKLKS